MEIERYEYRENAQSTKPDGFVMRYRDGSWAAAGWGGHLIETTRKADAFEVLGAPIVTHEKYNANGRRVVSPTASVRRVR